MRTLLFLVFLLSIPIFCHAHEGGNYEQSDMLASMKTGEKSALLMVHFGTTYDDTRALTIDAINTKAQAAFSELKFQEAYTSRIIIRRLKVRSIEKLTPLDALLKLRSEGYTHIIVQSTNIIDGVEMESLRRDVESVLPFFKEIRVGTPDHAKNDIAGEWKEALGKEGYTVTTRLEGLGQVPEIQEIFIEHIRFGLKHRMLDIMTKKAAYAAGKDVE